MKREFPHPNYNAYKSDNDFGIIVLSDSATNNVQTVRLNPTSSYPSVGSSVTVAGYGDTTQSDFTTQLPESLMKVNVNVISNADCEDSSDGIDNYYNAITSNMLCASVNRGGKDACQVRSVFCIYSTTSSRQSNPPQFDHSISVLMFLRVRYYSSFQG